MTTRSVSSASLAIVLAAASLSAQTTLQINTGSTAGDQLGRSCSIIGDLDGDGQAELAFGAPYASVNGASSGSIRVTNGRTGATLYAFHGLAAGDRLGESVASAGDVDGDGFPDIVGGAPLHDQNGINSGMARVWSGRTGAVLYTWYGDQPGDWFGVSVDGAGDTNADGRADLIVGAPYGKASNTANIGEARIFSGLNGSVLRTFNSPSGVSVLGYSVSAAGDVNKDGKADVIVGAPQTTNTFQDQGRAYIYSGATGATLYTFQGTTAGEYFGNSVDGGGDINNDGWPDVVVGSPNADYAGGNSGSVFTYSGRTGALIYNLKGTASNDEMGRVCANAGRRRRRRLGRRHRRCAHEGPVGAERRHGARVVGSHGRGAVQRLRHAHRRAARLLGRRRQGRQRRRPARLHRRLADLRHEQLQPRHGPRARVERHPAADHELLHGGHEHVGLHRVDLDHRQPEPVLDGGLHAAREQHRQPEDGLPVLRPPRPVGALRLRLPVRRAGLRPHADPVDRGQRDGHELHRLPVGRPEPVAAPGQRSGRHRRFDALLPVLLPRRERLVLERGVLHGRPVSERGRASLARFRRERELARS
jgi:hypothetical protein